MVAGAIAGAPLSLWGSTVGTVVGWKASESLMGLSTEMFFMMLLKMMRFRDVTGLIVKGIPFARPARGDLLLFEGLCAEGAGDHDPDSAPAGQERRCSGLAPPASGRVFQGGIIVDGGHPAGQYDLVHAGVSRGPGLRSLAAGAAGTVIERTFVRNQIEEGAAR